MATQQPSTSNEQSADDKLFVTFLPASPSSVKFVFKEFNRRILNLTPGTFLQTGSIIFTYYEEKKAADGGGVIVVKNFKLPAGGVFVSKIDIEKGVELKNGDLILLMRRCDHTTVANDMCAVCGANLREKDGRPGERAFKSEAKFSVVHSEPNLLVACDEARQLGGKDEQNLLETRRLALLVDLDLTLIHTTDVPIEKGLEDVHSFELSDPSNTRHVTYHVRLRPHARRFLSETSHLFELHICTFGAREYAHRVARILDPDRSLFGRRILSRDECFDQASKRNNLHAIFPHGDHMALIIDDRDDVWDFVQNMVRVKPYKFFRHTGDINAPPGFEKFDDETENDLVPNVVKKKSHLTSYHEEMDDDYLLHLQDILCRLHAEWYKRYDQMKQGLSNQYPNTHQVVPYVRAQTLAGVCLTFSGLVPTHNQTMSHPLYELAGRFGAGVSVDVVETETLPAAPRTTHLVANRRGTAKIRRAENTPGVQIVNGQWLFVSTERWKRQAEESYRILQDPSNESPAGNWQVANGQLMKSHYSNNRVVVQGKEEEKENSNLKRKLNVDESESDESECEYDDQEEEEEEDDMAAALDAQFKN